MPVSGTSPWQSVALGKLTAVLGADKAAAAFQDTLHKIGRDELRSPDDLYLFARALCDAGGFAGAVGGLLSVHAVLHGAMGEGPSPPRTAERSDP